MQHKPLNGIRILELGGYISAPYASSLMCALGAEVVKVEKTGTGEDFRRHKNDRSPYFIQYNAGKRSLAVDLKTREGLDLVKALIPRFDVVLENLRTGKLAALGLGQAECAALRPDLVYASVTGFGNGGPFAQRPAYDTMGQSVGGLYSLLGNADTPQLTGTILADLITGLSTATGVLAALIGRNATGTGQHVETSIMEAVSTLTADAISQYFDDGRQNPTRESRHPQAQNFCLKTATGENIAIHLSSQQKFWHCLTKALDRPGLTDDPRFATYPDRERNYFELVDIVQTDFLTRPAAEWEKRLTDADVPFAPVLTMDDYINHPQTEWLDLIEPEDNGVSLLRPPWRFAGTRPDRGGVAPRVGQHTREIAAEVYDDTRIDELIAAGVLFSDS
ncbi:CaiB/BaiF CoA transferase family protein [Streptomyces sp. NPDC058247]|uniref:CaiB/BaiF CoA transferase family protein n=1 Tax=Streptomyces sp. NPDC058247 TaxID=3346401 RepID=UPI0036E993B5